MKKVSLWHRSMNILLTSAGFKMPVIKQEILKLLPKPASELRLAHIITAANVASDTAYVERDRAVMRECGFQVSDIALEDLTPETTYDALKGFDVIYVQGGNGFYLLKHARACGFEQAIRKILQDDTKWYIGISAGSYIACPTIEMHNWKQEKDQHGLDDVTAMSLVPFLVVVHYNREKYREKLAENIPAASCPVRILTDDQALLVQDDHVQLLGVGPEIMAESIVEASSSN